MSVAFDEDIVILEDMDFDISCEYEHYGPCDNIATLAVWVIPLCPCIPVFRYFCAPCWELRNSTGKVACQKCRKIQRAMDTIARVEKIR